jgi:hypothetical protein
MVVSELAGFRFPVRVTAGSEKRAGQIARRVERAFAWLSGILDFEPVIQLEVLGSNDWAERAAIPLYGMPHYGEGGLIWVPATDAELFADLVRMTLEDAPDDERQSFVKVYGDPPNVQSFVDLLCVHELAHLYHVQAGFQFRHRWLTELFCNVALHGYVVEVEPDARSALETFPLAARHIKTDRMAVSAIDEMDRAEGVNYGWYQLQLQAAAPDVWHAGGPALLADLYQRGAAKASEGGTPDPLHPAISRVVENWPV